MVRKDLTYCDTRIQTLSKKPRPKRKVDCINDFKRKGNYGCSNLKG